MISEYKIGEKFRIPQFVGDIVQQYIDEEAKEVRCLIQGEQNGSVWRLYISESILKLWGKKEE